MRKLIPKAIFVLLALAASIWVVIPPEKNLKLGKDLRGGASLIYSVQIKPGENPNEIIPKMIEVLKQRVDPDGLSEISMIQQGRDRIEITMPLPDKRVKALKQAFEDELKRLDAANVPPQRLDRVMRMPAGERETEVAALAAGDARRAELLRAAVGAYDRAAAKRAEYAKAVADKADQATVDRLINESGGADFDYDQAKAAVMKSSLSAVEVRRALQFSDESRSLLDNDSKKMVPIPSQRRAALERLRTEHPDAVAQLDAVVAKHAEYTQGRLLMDDPADLVRQLKGAGVLNFRITVPMGYDPAEVSRLRAQLHERGPRNVRSNEVRWYKVNQIRNWYNDFQQLRALEADPIAFFAHRGYIAAEYDGEYYLLCWDTRGSRLTQTEGQWAVSRSHETRDEVGKPAIAFEMDARGAVLLGELTRNHVGSQMAVLLDDQVYTAPTLQSAISNSGRITGEFPPEEVRYIIRVLSAGSLQAKLSPEPLSIQSLGPELGADNLEKGLHTGMVAFAIVAAFMILYYFNCGLIAVLALTCTGVLILGAMALNKAAFTMPGIAGVILTFSQAVDANVLIYERMREELRHGHDMRTAVRVGFQRAMPSIVDANVSHLIICTVLYQVGTQEIRGFAITLGIGVAATLFSAIVVSRLIFDVVLEVTHWRRTSMLPVVIPALQRMLEPKINWIGLRPIFMTGSAIVMAVSLVLMFQRGSELFDTEFRGGTQVTLTFKENPTKPGEGLTMTRHDAEERIKKYCEKAAKDDQIEKLSSAEVIPINPQSDGVTSGEFSFRTVADNPEVVKKALTEAFADYLEAKPPILFKGSDEADHAHAPVYRINFARLGENIDRSDARDDIGPFVGGVAIVLGDLQPPQKLSVLKERLGVARAQPEFPGALSRTLDIRVLEGTDEQVRSAVILVRDDSISFVDNEAQFDREVANQEWEIARTALTQTSTPASVQSFSAAIAQTFKAKALTATAVSLLLLIAYIWVRYGTLRWSLAAVLPLVHDMIALLGLLALSQFLHLKPATQGIASSLGILPFRIDLNMVAALLMIIGFSLNDKVIILDRIRENRGREKYATGQIVNDSINQTISRTLITSGTTLMTTIILYIFGGEGVRGFAYAFTLGVIVGTYSSIALAAPLVWSRRSDRAHRPGGSSATLSGGRSTGGAAPARGEAVLTGS